MTDTPAEAALHVREPLIEADKDVDAPELDDNDLVSPIIKIPGGKRILAEKISSLIPDPIERFIEPFFGGGAVFFHLYKTGRLATTKSVHITDFDRHLMEMYEDVRFDPKELHARLEHMHAEYLKAPEACYYHVRSLWNQRHWSPAKCIFLRFGAFNGIWRENKKGEMNAPWNKKAKLALPSLERLIAVSRALRKADIAHGSFEEILAFDAEDKKAGTVVYLDPPYDCDFTQYTAAGFSRGQQETLIALASEWSAAGAHVVYSNASTDFIKSALSKYWVGAKVEEVPVIRRINSKGSGRGPVMELLISSR